MSHRLTSLLALTFLLSCSILTSGCMTATPRLDRFAQDLERSLPGARLEPQAGFKLGRLSTSFLRGIAGAAVDADDDPDARAAVRITRGIKRIEVASYGLEDFEGGDVALDFDRSLSRAGWKTMVRVRDSEEHSWVLYQGDAERIRSLLVATLSFDEVVVVRLEGRLNDVFSTALDMARRNIDEEGDSESVDDEGPEPGPEVVASAEGPAQALEPSFP